MKILTKTKYLLSRVASFLLLALSANNAQAQILPPNSDSYNKNITLYGVEAPITIKTGIGIVINYAFGLLMIFAIIIAPILGYRWLFKKGSASYTKRLVGYLKWILAISLILILLKWLISFVAS